LYLLVLSVFLFWKDFASDCTKAGKAEISVGGGTGVPAVFRARSLEVITSRSSVSIGGGGLS